jgi:hypothetical protein
MLFSFIWSQPNPSIAAGRDYSLLYVCSQTPAAWLWYFFYCVCSDLEFHTIPVHHTVTAKDCMEDVEIDRQVVCYFDPNCCTQNEWFFQWTSGDKIQRSCTWMRIPPHSAFPCYIFQKLSFWWWKRPSVPMQACWWTFSSLWYHSFWNVFNVENIIIQGCK